ncbi:MAG: type II secretion system protein [Desulfatiglans sp.]|jgi:general secretion pathway protein J|nr:type II secretion system protein [Desulfatiglans sp.]
MIACLNRFRISTILLSGQKRVNGQYGFTLLEIVVAIAIFAVIVSLIYPAYTGTYRNIEIAETQAEIYAMARTAMIRIVEDLESTYIPEPSGGGQGVTASEALIGEDDFIEGRESDRIRFFSRSHIDLEKSQDEAGDAKIAYYPILKEDKSIILYRSDTRANLEWPDENTGGWRICEGLHSVNFTYRGKDGNIYDAWDKSVAGPGTGLPPMVTVTLEFIDKDNPEKPLTFSTSVALPLSN